MREQFPLAVFEYKNIHKVDQVLTSMLWPNINFRGLTPNSDGYDETIKRIKDDFENTIDTDGVFKYILLNDIPEGNSYCVYLDMLFLMDNEPIPWPGPNRLPVEMPERIKNDSKNRLVYWICNNYCEAWIDSPFILPNELARCLYTIPKNILWISGIHISQEQLKQYEVKTGLNYMYANNMNERVGSKIRKNRNTGKRRQDLSKFRHIQINNTNEFYKFYDQKITDILSKKQLEKKSICYTRKCKEHRIYTLAWMRYKNLLDGCFWSKGISHKANKHKYIFKCQFAKDPFFDCIKPHINFLTDIEQKPQFEENINLNINQATTICFEHPLRSYFYISIETYYHDMAFLTEKSYKPMVLMQPFIICGPKNSVQVLRNQGFKTFDKWIDHSYDNESDEIKRFILYIKEIERLHAINSQKWSLMLYDILPDLIYNKDLLDLGIPSKSTGTLLQKTHEFFNR